MLPLSPSYHYDKFIVASLLGRLPGRKASRSLLGHVKTELLSHFKMMAASAELYERACSAIEETWPIAESRMYKWRGLADFMLEYGVHSSLFYPLLLDVPNAAATLPAYGKVRNLFGNVVDIPKDDLLYRFARQDRMYASLAFRNKYLQGYLRKAKTPISLGAGGLPEYWTNGFEVPVDQKLVAYDRDGTLFEQLCCFLGEDWQNKYNIDRRVADFRSVTKDVANYMAHDLVYAMGVASYYEDLEGFLRYLKFSKSSDGLIIIDRQLLCREAVFDGVVLDWSSARPPMKPARNVAAAIRETEAACRSLGLRIEDWVSVNPAGVVFVIK